MFRSKLSILSRRLSQIDDPRNPKKVKHKLTVLFIYGILIFSPPMIVSDEEIGQPPNEGNAGFIEDDIELDDETVNNEHRDYKKNGQKGRKNRL